MSLKIRADFDEAARQFKSLADASDATREKIERFTERFKAESIDKFIDRQDLLATAMQATGRNTDAVNTQVQNYQREIERLIKSGLDPQDEALQKLQSEYAELKGEQERITQATEAEAEAARQLAAENAKLAAEWAATADAGSEYEKKTAELTHRKKELKDEIQNLIKSGISPESEEIKKLEADYKNLTDQIKANEAAHKAQETAVNVAKGALLGIGAALAAGAAFSIKAAAANEDMIASFVPMMNGSVEKATELFKTIQKEAATTPFEIDKIGASVRTLMPAFKGSAKEATAAFRMLGDTAQGNSEKLESITRAYTAVMLKGKVSMKELNTIAGAGVPIYTELAKSMGKTETEMMKMSSEGKITAADLTGAFRQMTGEGGLFFNGMEAASDTFNMRLLGIKENVGILAGVIGENLLPVVKDIAGSVLDAVQSFTSWIQQGDNFKKVTDTLTYALAGLTAGLVAFLVVTKGAAALQAIATAFGGLNAAIAANPIGAIAVLITAVLIPALIYLYKNWDTVQTYISQGVARLEYAFKWFGSVITEKLLVAFSVIKAAGATLIDFIFGNIIRSVGKMLEVMGQLPFVGEMFNKASQAVSGLGNAMGDMAAEARKAVVETIKTAHEEQQATEYALNARLAAIDRIAERNRAAIEEEKERSKKEHEEEIAEIERTEAAITAAKLAALKDRLSKIALTENQERNEQINAVTQFLQQRAELESKDFARQIEFLQEQKDYILNTVAKTADERIAIETAFTEAIADIQQKQANFERDLLEKKLNALNTYFSGFGQLLELAGEKSRGAAEFAKALASAEAAINSYLAFTNAMASVPYPYNFVAAAGVLATGLAQQAKIFSTPIPNAKTAETGGRFMVPDLSPRVDGVGLRVNPGETIDVTPRGETGGNVITLNVVIDGAVLARIINMRARAGELYNLQLARNL